MEAVWKVGDEVLVALFDVPGLVAEVGPYDYSYGRFSYLVLMVNGQQEWFNDDDLSATEEEEE